MPLLAARELRIPILEKEFQLIEKTDSEEDDDDDDEFEESSSVPGLDSE